LTFASTLFDEGYAYLRFSFRGYGEGLEKSEGEFEDFNSNNKAFLNKLTL